MKEVTVIFPHQLWRYHPALSKSRPVYLAEETLSLSCTSFTNKSLSCCARACGTTPRQGYDVHYTGRMKPMPTVAI